MSLVFLEENTMTLASKIIIILKAILITLLISVDKQNTYFIYLNNPETVQSKGILHKKTFAKDSHVRYFFHYKNGTDKSVKFNITSDQPVTKLKKSIASDFMPEIAGSKAVKNFFLAKESTGKINLSSNLEPDYTISGILEGDFKKGNTIQYYFGDNSKIISSYDIYQHNYDFNYDLNIGLNQKTNYRLGSGITNTVKGQYGSTINLNVVPNQSGILKMSFSPRGGSGLLVFSNRGKIFITKLMPAFKNYDAFIINVEKGKKETFTFIPCGGLNYPINLEFSLQSYELNPDIA
jgi:hypothetical protein